MFTKITMYGFAMIFGFGIAFIIGFSALSSSPYAFSTKDINETTTTAQLTSNLNNSTIQDSKIIFVTDGLFSDAGWGAFGYNAARAIENKYGYHIDFKENVAIPDIESTLIEYAKDGYELIIAHGYEWGKPAIKVGKNYPDTKIIVFVGGEKYPNLINIFEGYKQGAKDINPNAKVLATYLDEWDSPAKGKEAALSHINSGADFLLQVADTSGSGVIEAAKEKKIFAFGSVSDQYKLAPNTVLTSFVLDEEKAFDQAIKMIQNSNFTGKIFKPGLEPYKEAPGDGIIYIAPFYGLENKVPEDVKTKFNTLKEDVINKKIVIPERYEITKVD